MRLRLGSALSFVCLSAAFCFTWYAARSGSGGTGLDVYQSQFLELHQRLLFAEKENQKRSYELNSVLNEIKRVVGERTNASTNVTDSIKWKLLSVTNGLPVHLTNIQYYLPHLQQHEDGIYPNVVIGQGRSGVSLVMGIPTVRRPKKTYLMDTLNSLFYEMSMKQKNDCVIVIFVAEVDTEYVNSVAENVRSSFPNEVLSGALEVISPPASYYPQLSNLKETFGDSKDRVRWRTKQNLDYSFLMLYAQPKGTFYLQLEDDIIAKPDYIQIIKDFAKQQSSNDWMILEFSQLGFIGKLFRSRDLPLIVEFFLMFHKDKPIDWLLDHLLWVKVCSPEKDAKHCERQKAYLRISYKPSLFQHVGLHSSLAGKIQNLKDKDFGKSRLFKAHDNPSAKVSTSLKVFQHFTLEKAYKGAECFWAFAPVAGDYILFSFFQPLKIERYFFRSGNMEHPGDKLVNTTVEVLPADKTNLQLAKDNMQNFKRTQDGYLQIGAFENGIADGKISPSIGKIHALRLSVHSSSPMWALLSEIFLKT
ncbi:alpha-1,3-mannosyl-glycoprotein 4-beta-N-acetylglucosaminyltransferase-like protein MGAT4D isoform X1 [Sphaerodactylus townsendi]|uniref:alpha-1,3-mannosyl-glycoprotein 4-beta-N-acetylglucosaminyltransferase-like protein MGAT4D isoform X1 n=1 Tax=Sphaerodactylus townsendi TaxID=933632 RepID=UPI0020262453|nr:alpha-1,3-mannosyl-glycoprotein 4-beta-N-acetylglucosaminyltransferase-like protein MGAT4D isoform X1 [Sphaerodactylus townsendi]